MTRLPDEAWKALLHAALDREASADELARLGAEIAADPARAREFARLSILDDALERAATTGAQGRSAALRLRFRRFIERAALVAAILAVVAGAAWFALGTERSASATGVLARLASVARSGDRTYLLRVPEGSERRPATRRDPTLRPQPPVDGAILSLRGSSSYVLVRIDEDGRSVLTGSDGAIAWSVGPGGRARISRDLGRFSGALPGSRHGIAFLDPREGLDALDRSYRLTFVAPSAIDPSARIVGERRSEARGGPRRIEIVYDPTSLVIGSMRLDGLPQARGGPRSVEFELLDEQALPPGYFSHSFHADPAQPVIEDH